MDRNTVSLSGGTLCFTYVSGLLTLLLLCIEYGANRYIYIYIYEGERPAAAASSTYLTPI